MVSVDDSVRIDCRNYSIDSSGWEEFNVTSLIQKFANGTDNFGFYIKDNDFNGNINRSYTSSEGEIVSKRPKLEITYVENAILGSTKFYPSNLIKFQNIGNNFSFYISIDGNYEVVITSLQGKLISSFSGTGATHFFIGNNDFNSNCYLISLIKNNKVFFAQKIIFVE